MTPSRGSKPRDGAPPKHDRFKMLRVTILLTKGLIGVLYAFAAPEMNGGNDLPMMPC